MNWKNLFTSPAPTTAWLLDSEVVAAVRRDRDGSLHCAVETMPQGACEVGHVGLQQVDRNRLAAVLGSVQGRIDGARRATVVVPTGWVRTQLFYFSELPRRQSELDQIVRWRLKKLLPVLPSELRVSAIPQRAADGQRPLLCMVGVERAIANLEASFSEVGVEPGLVTPRLFALAGGANGGQRLVVQHERGYLSLLLIVDDVPRLVRTKPLPGGGGVEATVLRELQLAQRFIRADLGVSGRIDVTVSAESASVRDATARWLSDQDGLATAAGMGPRGLVDPVIAARLGEARLDPMLRLTVGGAG
jgi:post-segregation antitoxin (ccd killing protein)